jgi:hypothetical protein
MPRLTTAIQQRPADQQEQAEGEDDEARCRGNDPHLAWVLSPYVNPHAHKNRCPFGEAVSRLVVDRSTDPSPPKVPPKAPASYVPTAEYPEVSCAGDRSYVIFHSSGLIASAVIAPRTSQRGT